MMVIGPFLGGGTNASRGAVGPSAERRTAVGAPGRRRCPSGRLGACVPDRRAPGRRGAYNPDVILLDEPFSAMDTFLKEQLRIELVNLLRDFDGFSILVTHDRDEVFQFCDELLILDKGKIIAKGDTHELFENPGKVQVARLTGCKNISKIEVIDEYHLETLDWGVVFEVSEKISPNITHIGIRAHDFSPAEKDDVNVFDTKNAKKLEMPFEWEIIFIFLQTFR